MSPKGPGPGTSPGKVAVRPPASSEAARRTMAANRSRDTKPELLLRSLLRAGGYPGYRLHWKKAPGRPDIAYPGRKVAIFVNGCYWHRCPSCRPPAPKANAEFWEAKFVANETRDARQHQVLEQSGWTVLIVWECELRRDPAAAAARVLSKLREKSA